jgi:hypothetical protein
MVFWINQSKFTGFHCNSYFGLLGSEYSVFRVGDVGDMFLWLLCAYQTMWCYDPEVTHCILVAVRHHTWYMEVTCFSIHPSVICSLSFDLRHSTCHLGRNMKLYL